MTTAIAKKYGHTVRESAVKGETRSAIYTCCEQHRFSLTIRFEAAANRLVQFIGLNPSTATELVDDPTVRRCKNFAKSWGYGGMVMTNAFSFRSTDPGALYGVADEQGFVNGEYLLAIARNEQVKEVVLCWGNHGTHLARGSVIVELLEPAKHKLRYLKLNAGGIPAHPLYLPGNLKPQGFYHEDQNQKAAAEGTSQDSCSASTIHPRTFKKRCRFGIDSQD